MPRGGECKASPWPIIAYLSSLFAFLDTLYFAFADTLFLRLGYMLDYCGLLLRLFDVVQHLILW